MEQNCVLLDTSFFIRLLNEEDALHENAFGQFRYFLAHDFVRKISTIAIAEYCVRGEVRELPLKNMLIVPFNFDHAQRAGKMIAEVYSEKKSAVQPLLQEQQYLMIPRCLRKLIWNLISTFYGTADVECKKVYDMIKTSEGKLSFDFIDITIPYTTFFGVLDFKE